MDRSILYQIADDEIRQKSFDKQLMADCQKESNGVEFRARELYWQKRSLVWEQHRRNFPDLSEQRFIEELRSQLKQRSSGRHLRSEIVSWCWVIACFTFLVSAAVFFYAAKSALYSDTGNQIKYCICGTISFVLALIAFGIVKRDNQTDN